jgi:hypothetical protein
MSKNASIKQAPHIYIRDLRGPLPLLPMEHAANNVCTPGESSADRATLKLRKTL